MRNQWSICLLMFLLPWFSACKKNGSEPQAPVETYSADTLRSQQRLSVVHVPVEIPMAEVERQINAQVKDLLYEDDDPNNNGGDNLQIKVWKKPGLRVEAQGDVFNITLPLKIWAKAGFKFEQFGIKLQDSRETDFEVNVRFSTRIAFGNDWKVSTITSANGFDWVTKPTLRLGPIEVPLASIVGNLIDQQQSRLTRLLDDGVRDKVDLKPFVQRAWTWLQSPLPISQLQDTWLRITPTEVLMTPLTGTGDRVRASLGIRAMTQTFVGEKPAGVALSPVPNLTLVAEVPDDFQIGLSGEVSHEYATRMAARQLVGQQYSFRGEKYRVEITTIDLYGSGEKLVVKAGLKGSVNGNIYLKGKPVYDAASQTLSLQNLDYDLDTKNKLLKTANWFLRGRFTRMMQDRFRIPVGAQIEEAKKTIQAGLTNNHVAKGITLNGRLDELSPDHVFITPTSIVAVVLAKGRVDVKIEGL